MERGIFSKCKYKNVLRMQTFIALWEQCILFQILKIQHRAHSSQLFTRFLMVIDLNRTVHGKDIRKERHDGN